MIPNLNIFFRHCLKTDCISSFNFLIDEMAAILAYSTQSTILPYSTTSIIQPIVNEYCDTFRNVIYTDGGNRLTQDGKPGAYCYIIYDKDGTSSIGCAGYMGDVQILNSSPNTHCTNNRMEAAAVIFALRKAISLNMNNVTLYSDCEIVVKSWEIWMESWKKKNYKDVANVDLIKELEKLKSLINAKLIHIKRSSHPLNVACDRMCNQLMDAL